MHYFKKGFVEPTSKSVYKLYSASALYSSVCSLVKCIDNPDAFVLVSCSSTAVSVLLTGSSVSRGQASALRPLSLLHNTGQHIQRGFEVSEVDIHWYRSLFICALSIYPSATNDPVSFIKSKWQSELIILIFLLCFLVQWFLVNRSFKVMWSGVWADIVSLCRQCVCQEIYSC